MDPMFDQLSVSIKALWIIYCYIPPNSSDYLYNCHICNIITISDSLKIIIDRYVLGLFSLWSEIPNSNVFLPNNVNVFRNEN